MLSIATQAHAQTADETHIPIAETPSGAETHAATEAHGDEHGGFPPFEPAGYASQLFWLAVTFGFLYWLVSRIVVPRIGGILQQRNDRIAGDLASAQRLKAETDAAAAAYEQALAEARGRAQAIAQEARDRAKGETEAERKRLEAEVNGRMQDAEVRISEVKVRALGEVDAIARDTTQALVEALLGSGAPEGEVSAAVNAAMAERG